MVRINPIHFATERFSLTMPPLDLLTRIGLILVYRILGYPNHFLRRPLYCPQHGGCGANLTYRGDVALMER